MKCILSAYFLVVSVFVLHKECAAVDKVRIVSPDDPWYVDIFKKLEVEEQDVRICGGTLLDFETVMTAAHCFWENALGRVGDASKFRITVGRRDHEQNSSVKRIDVPDGYIGGNFARNNIALVHLEKPFISSPPWVRFMNPNFSNPDSVCRKMKAGKRIYGWKETEAGYHGPVLTPNDYVIFGNCSTTISTYFGGTLPEDEFCINLYSRSKGGSDVGGCGLQVYLDDLLSLHLYGIVSFTRADVAYSTHAVFTNVTYHLDWIRTVFPGARGLTTEQPDCILPEQPTGGSFEPGSGENSQRPGTILRYKCNEGYTLLGNSTITCKNKAWTQPPSCLKPGTIREAVGARVNLSQPATLRCIVEGNPLSNFSWVYINASEIRKHSGIEENQLSPNKTYVAMSLNFTSVTREDNGTYECRAMGYNGPIATQIFLIVTEVPEVTIKKAKAVGNYSVYLEWTIYDGNDLVEAYHIQMKQGPNPWKDCLEKVYKSSSSYVVRGLEKSNAYQFRITAENAVGVSQPADSQWVTTLADDPGKFTPTFEVHRDTPTSFRVHWSSPPKSLQELIHYYEINATYEERVKSSTHIFLPKTTFVLQGLEPGVDYQITVSACSNYTKQCGPSGEPESGSNVAMYSGFIVAIFIFVIMATWMGIRKHSDLASRKRFMDATLILFKAGAMASLDPKKDVAEQAELLPYNQKWEFPRNRLKLGKVLGSGAFGIVKIGLAKSICKKHVVTMVAVKMVRATCSLEHMTALTRELKILMNLGKHLNIVNLLGACTKKVSYGELLVIVEFCRFGNLRDYLLIRRCDFVGDQASVATGNIAGPSFRKACVAANDSGNSTGSGRNLATDDYDHSIELKNARVTINDPASDADYVEPDQGKEYQGDFTDQDLKPICTRDLLSWAWQVSRGMAYLSSKKVLHGDLAARNILLTDHNVVKICDFGLAKSLYSDDIYKKEGRGPLPIKWMAIESIKDRVFSVKSDVWSFGVVLWEFFTLAETPYPGIPNENVYQKLIEGFRMEQPKHATNDIYNMMLSCWDVEQSKRPSFGELEASIENLLEEEVKADYLDLDAPYAELNAKALADGKQDYLTMKPSECGTNSTEPTVDPSGNNYWIIA